jgi:acyl-coenzyme A synthetase/AMP-(fatty) acid ligase
MAETFNASEYLLDRRVVLFDSYPTTATGKVRRVELRAMAATVLGEPPPEKA